MATMLLPSFVGMIPRADDELAGWMNQPRALYVPSAVAPLGIFMMRQYIASAIPKRLVDAARIDGCGEFAIYWRIGAAADRPGAGHARPDHLHRLVEQLSSGPLVVIRDMEDVFTVPDRCARCPPGNTE